MVPRAFWSARIPLTVISQSEALGLSAARLWLKERPSESPSELCERAAIALSRCHIGWQLIRRSASRICVRLSLLRRCTVERRGILGNGRIPLRLFRRFALPRMSLASMQLSARAARSCCGDGGRRSIVACPAFKAGRKRGMSAKGDPAGDCMHVEVKPDGSDAWRLEAIAKLIQRGGVRMLLPPPCRRRGASACPCAATDQSLNAHEPLLCP